MNINYFNYIFCCLLSSFLLLTHLSPLANAQDTSAGLFKSFVFTPVNSFTSGVEGPAVDSKGNLYAVNFHHSGTIGIVTPEGKAGIFLELPEGSIANGIRFDSHGNMLIADYTGHNILKVDMATKELSIFVNRPEMTQPNDIAIDSKDRIYASDPDFKNRAGRVWRIDPDKKVTLLDSEGLGPANGIEVSTDEKTLYVNAGRRIWAYDLSEKGEVSNRRVLVDHSAGFDGMRCDIQGNIWAACIGNGTVTKFSPDGKMLQEVPLIGKAPTNVAFGGKDGCTIYVTLMDQANIESFRVDVPGREWMMRQNR
ncbi:MAG TPA: SMP-30/gluconolactonase/LRE family protein [Bacteroidales bacterium]|jgi:sugar lactone lactonase YvrE|nr:SMP-30/gluconolactonase/LRE family protein [Bacteroidales bacterium]HQH25712.1 SMP-30/gluconolactonase/LRE family protein [Bacteroidales bacterium]HQJ83394.1 SMP-30/gluconolactonase/LRE family protein [Bacteroidales bacterium]